MAGSNYFDKCFSTSDHYGMVPPPIDTADPSCDSAAQVYYSKRVPSKEIGSYDPNRQIVTSYGITPQNDHEIGWHRIDKEGSSFDPDSSITRAVILSDNSGEVTIYTHVWPRVIKDPMAHTSSFTRQSLIEATKLRGDIAKLLTRFKNK